MNKLLAGLALACALSACATPQSPQLTAGKTVAGLWSSLQAASNAADAAVRTGVLKGHSAAVVADDLVKTRAIIATADAAYHANPATDVTAQVVQATAILSAALCIIQPTPGCPTQAVQ